MPVEKISKKPRGGARPGSGRKKGALNKQTADVKALAQSYGEQAIMTLVNIMTAGESDTSRASAANALLDRGFGRPVQSVDANVSGALGLNLNVTFG